MADNSRFSVSLNPELAKMVEDYRFEHRISTKNRAVQRLLEMGFQSMGGKKSGPAEETELDHQERELIRIARGLDPYRQELLLRLAAVVAEKDSPSIP